MKRATLPEIPYVRGVVDGAVSQHDFIRSQLQFFFAVEAYPKHLTALASRLKQAGAKRALEENIRDEAGTDQAAHARTATFRALLANLAIIDAESESTPH